MKLYVIHPGAGWATSDVYDGLVAGLYANNIDVYEGRIDTILNWYDAALTTGVQSHNWKPEALDTRVFNRQRMASAHITQHILDVWPDVVLCVSGHNYHIKDADALRHIGIKTAVLLTESPYFGDLEAQIRQHYDIAFTNERRSAQRLDAHYLPHAYHPERHTLVGEHAYAADVVFIGSWFDERKELFNAVDWTGIDFVWRGHDLNETVPSAAVPNVETAAYYRAAKISLNHHRTTTSHGSKQHIRREEAESMGPRAYEIPACGSFQLMDDSRPEAREIFRDSIATYRSGDADDLETQVRWWLSHPDMRDEWAAAQHEMILPHSWTNRARQVLEVLA